MEIRGRAADFGLSEFGPKCEKKQQGIYQWLKTFRYQLIRFDVNTRAGSRHLACLLVTLLGILGILCIGYIAIYAEEYLGSKAPNRRHTISLIAWEKSYTFCSLVQTPKHLINLFRIGLRDTCRAPNHNVTEACFLTKVCGVK